MTKQTTLSSLSDALAEAADLADVADALDLELVDSRGSDRLAVLRDSEGRDVDDGHRLGVGQGAAVAGQGAQRG